MNIKLHDSGPCQSCGALDSCCSSSKSRQETADSLAALANKQADTIAKIRREADFYKGHFERLREELRYVREAAGR